MDENSTSKYLRAYYVRRRLYVKLPKIVTFHIFDTIVRFVICWQDLLEKCHIMLDLANKVSILVI